MKRLWVWFQIPHCNQLSLVKVGIVTKNIHNYVKNVKIYLPFPAYLDKSEFSSYYLAKYHIEIYLNAEADM